MKKVDTQNQKMLKIREHIENVLQKPYYFIDSNKGEKKLGSYKLIKETNDKDGEIRKQSDAATELLNILENIKKHYDNPSIWDLLNENTKAIFGKSDLPEHKELIFKEPIFSSSKISRERLLKLFTFLLVAIFTIAIIVIMPPTGMRFIDITVRTIIALNVVVPASMLTVLIVATVASVVDKLRQERETPEQTIEKREKYDAVDLIIKGVKDEIKTQLIETQLNTTNSVQQQTNENNNSPDNTDNGNNNYMDLPLLDPENLRKLDNTSNPSIKTQVNYAGQPIVNKINDKQLQGKTLDDIFNNITNQLLQKHINQTKYQDIL